MGIKELIFENEKNKKIHNIKTKINKLTENTTNEQYLKLLIDSIQDEKLKKAFILFNDYRVRQTKELISETKDILLESIELTETNKLGSIIVNKIFYLLVIFIISMVILGIFKQDSFNTIIKESESIFKIYNEKDN